MSTRSTNFLKEPFRSSIIELIAKANAAGIPAFITDTTRTLNEQKRLVAEGKSWTLKSRHLTGHAADIAFQINGKLRYDAELYTRLYEITKGISFVVWPYKDYGWGKDKPHHSYDKNKEIGDNEPMEKTKELIRTLNTEIGKTTRERDEARKALAQEKHSNQETLDKYRSCQREREALREGKRGILDKIKALFKG